MPCLYVSALYANIALPFTLRYDVYAITRLDASERLRRLRCYFEAR